MGHELEPLFNPESVALIGASSTPGKVGHSLCINLTKRGYNGRFYLINPNRKKIGRYKTYPSVLDIEDDVDLVVIAVPARFVKEVMEESGKKGVKAAVIISSGFRESGNPKLEDEIIQIARSYGIRVVGPNCLGIINLHNHLNTTFNATQPPKGPISFISQSGSVCTAVIEYAKEEYLGFSKFISIGNKADLDDADIIDYLAQDDDTKCIAIYIESVKNGRKFYHALRNAVKSTPVVVLKVGTTEAGAHAASSHTGALAGSDVAYEAAIKQAGAIRARTLYQLFDYSRALAYQSPVMGEGIAILTNAGGPGVIAADVAYNLGLPLSVLSKNTKNKISDVCPPSWSHGNPVDIIGDADVERYSSTLEILMEAEEVHGVVTIAGPQAVMKLTDIAKKIVEISYRYTKPMTACFVGVVSHPSENYLDMHGIPEMDSPERAVRAMYALYMRGKYLKREGLA